VKCTAATSMEFLEAWHKQVLLGYKIWQNNSYTPG